MRPGGLTKSTALTWGFRKTFLGADELGPWDDAEAFLLGPSLSVKAF